VGKTTLSLKKKLSCC